MSRANPTVVDRITGVIVMAIIGFIIGAGMRAAEWIIPKPETRVVVCMADDLDVVACKSLNSLVNAEKP